MNELRLPFNPINLPIFLGIFFKEENKSYAIWEIQDYMTGGLFFLQTNFKDDVIITQNL